MIAIHGDPDVSLETVPDPPDAQLANVHDAVDATDNAFCGVHELRVDGVHETLSDTASRLKEHPNDRSADHKPDDRISPLPTDGDSHGTDENGQRGQAVGAGMKTVCDERSGPDL